MPFNRRQFVAVSATSLAILPSPGFGLSLPRESFVVVDDCVPESVLFAELFPRSHYLSGGLTDVMALQLDIAQQIRAGHSVYGCTLGAQTFVIDEMLHAHELALEIIGRHRKLDAHRWRHEIRLASVVRNKSIFTEPNWPQRYARALHEVDAELATDPVSLLVDNAGSAHTRGFVTTWRVRAA